MESLLLLASREASRSFMLRDWIGNFAENLSLAGELWRV